LLYVAAEHRPALRKVDHASEKLAQNNPIIGSVIGPELWIVPCKTAALCIKRTNNGDEYNPFRC
jgi:hypothetical protein